MILPGCQDTGTAIIMGKRGGEVFTEGVNNKKKKKIVIKLIRS